MRPTFPALLLASALIPSTALASPPASADVHPASLRVTTGVVAPQIVNSQNFTVTSDALRYETAAMPAVELSLDLNEKGIPGNVSVVKSANPVLDAQVLAAVRSFRFRPAMLDEQPVPINLHLIVLVRR